MKGKKVQAEYSHPISNQIIGQHRKELLLPALGPSGMQAGLYVFGARELSIIFCPLIPHLAVAFSEL